MSIYGKKPNVLADCVSLDVDEVGYCLYMPVSLAERNNIILPRHLEWALPILKIIRDERPHEFRENIVYLTVKRMIVGPSVTPNRPGWHTDGFGTNDLNYIWYDCVPTVFNFSSFNISDDHIKSLQEFEAQAQPENDFTYPCLALLELDPYVVHRVAMPDKEQMRTFVKVSLSPEQYNLKGNSRNYELHYSWPMYDRALVRNSPTKAQQDFHNPTDDHFK